jgi:hypothetical protein
MRLGGWEKDVEKQRLCVVEVTCKEREVSSSNTVGREAGGGEEELGGGACVAIWKGESLNRGAGLLSHRGIDLTKMLKG